MHLNWLVFIGVEVEDESEVFVYFRHRIFVISRCKDTKIILFGKIISQIIVPSCPLMSFALLVI